MAFSVGIDLGTTNTVVSTARRGTNGSIEVTTEKITQIGEDGYSLESDALLPSVLYVNDGEHNVGKIAKAMKGQNTSRVISNSKSYMGLSDHYWEIDKKEYSPELVASYFLSATRNFLLENYSKEEQLKTAVITVPASFDIDQRNATKMAAKLAGFDGDITLISEPTAAILDFINEQSKLIDEDKYLDFSDYKSVAVFDLGGGTCDVAILKVKIQGKEIYVEEVSVSPHTLLGGTDFDAYAVEGVLKDFSKENNIDLSKELSKELLKELKEKLLVAMEKTKIYFVTRYFAKKNQTENDEIDLDSIQFTIQIPQAINDKPFKYTVTMKKYDKYIKALLDNSSEKNVIKPIEETLNSCNMNKNDVDYIFCVGGMTKYPKVIKTVSEFFGKEPIRLIDSMESVSRGAAIYHHYDIKEVSKREIDIIPTLPQTVFLNIKNNFPKELIAAKTKANTPIIYEDLIEVSSQVGVSLELYTGKSQFDPNMKRLNNIKIDFPYGVKLGSKISLKLEYTQKGILNFEAWIKEYPEINIKITLEGTQMKDSEIDEFKEKYKIEKVKGVL